MAVDSISLQGVQQGPLVAVPERVLLTTQAARQAMGPALERAQARQPWWAAMARRQPQALDPTLLLALFLATERQKGAASAWWPYVAALSDDPPCGWALAPHQLDASLAALGSLAGGWAPRVHAAAAAVQQRCEAAAQSYGDELGVSAGDVRWALGHVVSRCFGSGGRDPRAGRTGRRSGRHSVFAGAAAGRFLQARLPPHICGTRVMLQLQVMISRCSLSLTCATTTSMPARRRGEAHSGARGRVGVCMHAWHA